LIVFDFRPAPIRFRFTRLLFKVRTAPQIAASGCALAMWRHSLLVKPKPKMI